MLKELVFGISSIKGPIWLKEFNKESEQLEDLKKLSDKVKSDKKRLIDRDIMYLSYGMDGEKNVAYEIKNSYIPMLVLHDIRIEDGDSVAQMDYVLVTKNFILVLETKSLNGDITVNESGEFIRCFKNKSGHVYKKEGIYSPVSQNERHVRILNEYLKKNKIIKNLPIYSCVVIANPKGIINKYRAPQEIQNQIIKCEQLTSFIKGKLEYHRVRQDFKILDKVEYNIGEFLLKNNKPIKFDYYKKYSLCDDDFIKDDSVITSNEEVHNDNSNKNNILFHENIKLKEKSILKDESKEIIRKELKQLRISFASKEKLPPYCIFNDETLNDILDKMPKNKEELINVKGLAKVKINKYGEAILGVLR